MLTDRSQFFKDLTMPFYGYNRPGCEDFGGRVRVVLVARHATGMPAAYFCIKAFPETDMTEDLKKIDVPALILGNLATSR